MGSLPNNSQSLLQHAVAGADDTVDFGAYDNDGADGVPNSGDDDGFVDAAFVIYAGTSAAQGGGGAIWPHAWQHEVATSDPAAGGGTIKVSRYAALPEQVDDGVDGDLLTVGLAAHEFGHILGLPDLHDTDETGAHGVGN